MTWVKICGMTNLQDALTAVEAGADAVGFIFFEKSPRNITVDAAREIVRNLPESVEKVGIFVGQTADAVKKISEGVKLTVAQTYPDFGNPLSIPNDRFLETVSIRVIVALQANQLQSEPDNPDVIVGFRISRAFRDRVVAVLLDSGTSGYPGGTGKIFDWRSAAPVTDLMGRVGLKLVVAGGLTAASVGDAMRLLTPWGVDVVSGVEASPGKKDPEKIRAFVRAVRAMDRKAS